MRHRRSARATEADGPTQCDHRPKSRGLSGRSHPECCMMQVLRRAARGAAAVLAATALAACDNEVPTATGSDLFPGGESPTTLIVDFSDALPKTPSGKIKRAELRG